ncbi:ricin-type beta-trefoil lectin domain protein [Streptomyces sp. NBC_00638]|uniref:ricin-type beta-trefoil lectin domain protein n=1 Tax=Streptomyces sp. NBC_00638 TaxID=2975794 RepID=UPI0022516535|nr:ricin-type beta-trefoil lectin domain protein [Streptomyces sp. NBC_00638]MCX5007784.1 ricin-type beta-trefoil lectin domain protein [Streptomyces sp. NBC_00638]
MFEVSDERLAAELRSPGGTPANYPVGELLDRHWEAVFSYARLCTDGVRPAGMLTTASFTRLFGDSLHQGGPSAAWRPQLLVTVRRIAAEWLMDQRRELLDPELLADADREDREDRAAARLLPPEGRRLLSRAFQRLPEPARCLLWHGEIEAEQLELPAALLGLSPDEAVVELERARERLREGCLEIHRELAPSEECRRYHRMLDVSFRRGGVDLDPDLRRHMSRCGHCRDAADQLNQFNGVLAVPLAEAVLGWGAPAYVASRQARAAARAEAAEAPGTGRGAQGTNFAEGADAAGSGRAAEADPIVEFRPETDAVRPPGLPPRTPPNAPPVGDSPAHDATAQHPAAPARQGAPTPDGGPRPSRRVAPRSGAGRRSSRRAAPHKASRRAPHRRNVALAVLTVGALILVPLVLWVADPGSDSGSGSGTADGNATAGKPSPGTNPSWVGSDKQADGTVRGRLRNAATGLCVGIAGEKPAKGAETRLTSCTSESAMEWSYTADGLLRDADHPDLCLDSHLGYSVQLAPCPGTSRPGAKNVRYDFTLRGMLVPRWNQDLALAPAAAKGESALVLKLRKDEPAQRWTLETPSPSLQLEVVNWDFSHGGATASATPGPTSSTAPEPAATRTPAVTPSTPEQATSSAAPRDDSCSSSYDSCHWDGGDGSDRDGGYGTGSSAGGTVGGGGQGGRR